MEQNDQPGDLRQRLVTHVIILGTFVATIWLLEFTDWIIGGSMDQYGILPRQLIGLRGIVAAPFLHGSFAHVAANTIPFVILGWFVLLRGTRNFAIVTGIVMIISGLGTWLIAPSTTIHIGASGIIFGFLGYLIFRGYFERSWQSIAWSAVVLLFYGGMLLGMLPTTAQVSWQMHLFGFLGGGVAAYLLSKPKEDVIKITIDDLSP
ncbi:MAG: rhomboid family intramembrane serine protease [Candidatus Promineifilaceae bacterium]